jgi:hypothetical protein
MSRTECSVLFQVLYNSVRAELRNSHVLLVRGTCPSRIGISHPGWASMYITYVASRVVRRTAYVRAVPCVPYRVLNFFQVSVPSSK